MKQTDLGLNPSSKRVPRLVVALRRVNGPVESSLATRRRSNEGDSAPIGSLNEVLVLNGVSAHVVQIFLEPSIRAAVWYRLAAIAVIRRWR